MSAYIVTQNTMRNVLTAVAVINSSVWGSEAIVFKSYGGDYKKLGDDLFELNELAVNTRYGSGTCIHNKYTYDTDFGHVNYRDIELSQLAQLCKSVSNLIYQCSEGSVPDLPLFKELEKCESHLAKIALQSTPEWNEAAWSA